MFVPFYNILFSEWNPDLTAIQGNGFSNSVQNVFNWDVYFDVSLDGMNGPPCPVSQVII